MDSAASGLRSYDVTELVSFGVQPNGSVLPNPLPTCAACGAIISNGYHDCVVARQTSVLPFGGVHLTPWGTWEWRPLVSERDSAANVPRLVVPGPDNGGWRFETVLLDAQVTDDDGVKTIIGFRAIEEVSICAC